MFINVFAFKHFFYVRNDSKIKAGKDRCQKKNKVKSDEWDRGINVYFVNV